MPAFFSLILLIVALVMPPLEVRADEKADIRAVIEGQISAFQADDGERAFSYAAPVIRQKFETAERFMAMVRQGYAAIYRPSEVRFGDLRQLQSGPVQEVLFRDSEQRAFTALYLMEQQPDGSWRIAGVYLLKNEELPS
jgi:ketosteroid isomerase-like protein